MMEQRQALTIPFTVEKDNLVSWTAFAGYKLRHNSLHKNGSMMTDRKCAALITLEMSRRRPLLVLTDVLKTDLGKAYMEGTKKGHIRRHRKQMANPQTTSGRVRKKSEPLTHSNNKSHQKKARNKRKRVVPKRKQRNTSSSSQRFNRLAHRRRLRNYDEKDKGKRQDSKKLIGKDNGGDNKFADVVDCGLSVSWEPTEDTAGCDEFSPASIKDSWTEPEKEVPHNLKRKRKASQCNGTTSPKRHRESVLRLTGEDGQDEGPAPASICPEESGEDEDLENLDRSIVQFTVGGDDRTESLVPVISPTLVAGDVIGSPKQSLSGNLDNTTETSHSEPIVLSSDDEESGDVSQRCSSGGVSRRRSQAVRPLVSVGDTVIQEMPSQKDVAKQQEISDIQDIEVLQVVVEDIPNSMAAPPLHDADFSNIEFAFSTLHCGGYQGRANGDIMIEKQKIIIPLKDTTENMVVMLSFERKELRKYSVWEQQELEAQKLQLKGNEEPCPPAVLLFCVSETAAAAIQRDLCQLCDQADGAKSTGKASPFILLTLREPLEGVKGALLRSVLDIECLNNMAHDQVIVTPVADRVGGFEDFLSPVLSLDDSIQLIRRTGLDSQLLSMLGMKSTDTGLNVDQNSSHSDGDKSPTEQVQPEDDSYKELVVEPAPEEQDEGMQLKPKEEQKEQELEHPAEKKKEEPTPVYTLCHRRSKGSYSVSLCKPDSKWTKYKHQGLTRRLIQFPPPPLKGGITVTMEDLQCLDNGQFLNDVIIDFYLKYLLQNASAAMAERSHIFSSFFYKQLTRRDNASEGGNSDFCQRQRRHQRVKTWTRHVDIFKKDFLFVPVNQEAHWYLVVICFPGLDDLAFKDWTGPKSPDGAGKAQGHSEAQGWKSPNYASETSPTLKQTDTQIEKAQEESTKDALPGPVNCTELTCQKKTVCKRPCILIMDSLKLSLHERVIKLLREYLQSEWEARRGSSREFGSDQMKSSHCKVPLQDNSSDCGLYLLQYVECFLKDPVVHFDLPLYLERWFPRQQVRRKRDNIRDLILYLYRQQNLDNRHMKMLFC